MRRVVITSVLVVLMVPSLASAAPRCHQVHRWVWRTEHHRREHVRVSVCPAKPPPVPAAPAGPVLANQSPAQQQILKTALVVAKGDGDAAPAFVVYVAGTLSGAAEAIDDGHSESFFPPGEAPGDASSPVDLVEMGGHFTSNGPIPSGAEAPKGTVAALTISATGFVEFTSIGDKLLPLSKLGTLTRLA
jgi:hypothetical protein